MTEADGEEKKENEADFIYWELQKERAVENSHVFLQEMELERSHGCSWGCSLYIGVYAAM